MKLNKIEEMYGKSLTKLLLDGMDWISSYSCYQPSQRTANVYNPTQAVIAAAFLALVKEDVSSFLKIHRVENLSYLQYPYMKSWLRDDHNFSRKIVLRCLTTLAWIVTDEKLSPQSPFVAAVTGLEEKYRLNGVFIQAVLMCAKRKWKVVESDENKASGMNNASTQTVFDVVENIPVTETNGKNDENVNPREEIAQLDKLEMIKILINDNDDIQNNSLKTLLQYAVMRENSTTIDTIMKLLGDTKNRDETISELLHVAVRRNSPKVLRTLLWHGLDTQYLDEQGNAPLHIAASSNLIRMVKVLTCAGADVNQINGSGLLPLHLTSDPEIIKHLLDKGAKLNAKTLAGDTAFHLAVSNGNNEVVKALLRYGSKSIPEIHDLLIEQKMVDIERFCPGKKLVYKGATQLETVMEVSEKEDIYNASSDMSDHLEKEAFQEMRTDYAITSQQLAAELKKDGPIHKAASEGRLEAVIEQLEKGVDIDTRGFGGYTALQYAAKYGHLKVVQSLIQKGADINLANDWNWTPLHHAAHYSRYDIVEVLLHAGANSQIVDSVYGMTPLTWANSNYKIIKLFNSRNILQA